MTVYPARANQVLMAPTVPPAAVAVHLELVDPAACTLVVRS